VAAAMSSDESRVNAYTRSVDADEATVNATGVRRVFLIYARSDKPIATGIADALRSAGLVVNEASTILPGQNLISAITESIENSDVIVVLVSEAARRSEWVQTEAALAVGSVLSNGDKTILPVALGKQDLPLTLRDFQALRLDARISPADAGDAAYAAIARMVPNKPEFLRESVRLQQQSQLLNQRLHSAQLERHSVKIAHRGQLLTIAVIFLVFISTSIALFLHPSSYFVRDILGIVAPLLGAAVGFYFGAASERSKQGSNT
jgi:TIR domain